MSGEKITVTVELTALFFKLMAAFKSRSITFPQLHTITRLLSFISWISPHAEHVLLLG